MIDGVAAAMFVAGGAGKVTVTLTAPRSLDGWTINSAFGAAFEEQDREDGSMATFYVGCKTSAPYTFDIIGLAAGKVYVVSAWFQLTKPDGTKVCGQALTAVAIAR